TWVDARTLRCTGTETKLLRTAERRQYPKFHELFFVMGYMDTSRRARVHHERSSSSGSMWHSATCSRTADASGAVVPAPVVPVSVVPVQQVPVPAPAVPVPVVRVMPVARERVVLVPVVPVRVVPVPVARVQVVRVVPVVPAVSVPVVPVPV